MPRVSQNHTQVAELKTAILDARATGASYRMIAQQCGCSLAYVQQVCNSPAPVVQKVSHDVIKQRALQLKQDAVNNRKRRGVLPIMADVAREFGLDQSDLLHTRRFSPGSMQSVTIFLLLGMRLTRALRGVTGLKISRVLMVSVC